MKFGAIVFLFLGLLVLCFSAYLFAAQDFGIMMDVSGEVSVKRDGQNMPADLGLNIFSGDTIVLGKNAGAVIVSYEDCQEWVIKGPDNVRIKINEGLISDSHKLAPSRQLPVCYGHEEFKEGVPDVTGGLVLRGQPKDLLASLREEYRNGNASNSTLMTLIMHDLKNGKKEQAKQYFNVLKKRAPESGFIKEISKMFEEK
jgi:hypothetical protein